MRVGYPTREVSRQSGSPGFAGNPGKPAPHPSYWKYTVRRRITGEGRGSFPVKGSNWFVRPDPTVHTEDWQAAWKADLATLDEVHRTLRAAVAALDPDALDTVPAGSKLTHLKTVTGIALHDVYHAGQINLLKRLAAAG